MKHDIQHVLPHLMTRIMAGVASAGFALAAAAAGPGAAVGVGAQAGGMAETHMSPPGSDNSNAQWQDGATRGADRADARMNAQGAAAGGAELEAPPSPASQRKGKR